MRHSIGILGALALSTAAISKIRPNAKSGEEPTKDATDATPKPVSRQVRRAAERRAAKGADFAKRADAEIAAQKQATARNIITPEREAA